MTTQLAIASLKQMSQLRGWFHSAAEQQSWGGDNFDYPCNDARFLELLCRSGTQSYSLLTPDGAELLGFGQLCDRFGCHHLARLVINPEYRGQGLAKTLIFALISQALSQQRRDISLYVHRHNTVALQCYQTLGFIIAAAPEQENTRLYFMKLDADSAVAAARRYVQQA